MKRGRPRGIIICEHTNAKHKANGLCKLCYKSSASIQHENYRKTTKGALRTLIGNALTSTKTRRARGKDMCDIEIDKEWILERIKIQQYKCYWTNMPIAFYAEKRHPCKVSLDRKDPTKGYSKDNTVLSAWCINAFRSGLSEAETREALKLLVYHMSVTELTTQKSLQSDLSLT